MSTMPTTKHKPAKAPNWVRTGMPPKDCTLTRHRDGTIEITRNQDMVRWMEIHRRLEAITTELALVVADRAELRKQLEALTND